MIRKRGVVAVLGAIAIILAFNFLFLDMIVKAGLVAAGEYSFRAKVEISRLHVQVMKSKVTIEGLAIGDRKDELKNLFEIGKVELDFRLLPMLKKKTIIDNVSIINLALGTVRKTSGFLPPAKLKKMEEQDKKNEKSGVFAKLKDKAAGEIKELPVTKLSNMGDMKNSGCAKGLKKEELASYKKIVEANAAVTAKKEATTAEISKIEVNARAKAIEDRINSAKNINVSSAQDIPEAQKRLKDLEDAKKEIEALNRDINSAKDKANAFYSYTTGIKKEIEEARQQDIDNAMKNAA